MADKTINTRLILRNDTIENWNSSTKVLLKGEAALGRLSGELSNYYQLRIGTGDKKWSELEPSNVIIPNSNISGLTERIAADESNTVYTLSSVALEEGETGSSFQMFSHEKDETEWTPVAGSRFNVPAFDPSDIEQKISDLSGEVKTISGDLDTLEGDYDTFKNTTVPAVSSALETLISETSAETLVSANAYADGIVDAAKTELTNLISTTSAETLVSANAYADQAEADAVAAAEAYTNAISTALSTDYQGQIDDIRDEIAGGIHFIGTVVDTKVEESKGYYKLTSEGEWTEAKNGDLVIKDSKEYIWSEAQTKWEEFGDEGNYATKAYVDTAKDEAISACTNRVSQVSAFSLLPTTGNINGDIGIVKVEIGETGKYEYTGYAWNGTAWAQMDGNYSAENVIMPSNMTITYQFGKYTIPSSGSKELTCAGMTLKNFLNDAFAEEKNPANPTLPTFTLTTSGASNEVGNTYKVPAATLKMTGVGSYTYGPATGIYVPATSAVVKCTTEGTEISSSSDMSLNSTLSLAAGTADKTYVDGATTYSYTAEANYVSGAVPVTNIGNPCSAKQITADKATKTASATFTGYRNTFYGTLNAKTGTIDSAYIRALTKTNGAKAKGNTLSISIPVNAQRVIFAYPKTLGEVASVKDVNGLNAEIKSAFTCITVAVEGANSYEAIDYYVYYTDYANPNDKANTYTVTI